MSVDIPVIETERLILRAPRLEDLGPLAEFRESERARSVGGPFPAGTSFTALCALAGHWQLRGFGRWIVTLKGDDTALGVVGPFHPDDWPEPEIAWTVFDGAEGRGIAFEAAAAARAWAYATLGWTRAVSLVDPANTRSVALARRLGAEAEGVHPHPTLGVLQIFRHPAPEACA